MVLWVSALMQYSTPRTLKQKEVDMYHEAKKEFLKMEDKEMSGWKPWNCIFTANKQKEWKVGEKHTNHWANYFVSKLVCLLDNKFMVCWASKRNARSEKRNTPKTTKNEKCYTVLLKKKIT